jgi:flagellar export protein FliJ
MTIKPRVVRALRDARTRLRDAAIAEHTLAAHDGLTASAQLASERGRLESVLDDAHVTLAAARNVHELGRVAELVTAHHGAIAIAAKVEADAAVVTEAAAAKLRERARALRAAEHLVELSDRHRNMRDAKREQRGNDDLSARRR